MLPRISRRCKGLCRGFGGQGIADKLCVAIYFHIDIRALYQGIRPNNEGATRNTHEGPAIHRFLHPDADAIRVGSTFVGEENERQLVVRLEGIEIRDWIRADPNDGVVQSLKLSLQITEGYCFGRSARGIRLWEEEEHHASLVTREVANCVHIAVCSQKGKVWHRLANLWYLAR
jgi:hypothetical protein